MLRREEGKEGREGGAGGRGGGKRKDAGKGERFGAKGIKN